MTLGLYSGHFRFMETANSMPATAESTLAESLPPILAALPDPQGISVCPRRARWQLDLLLLALESIDLNASELMLQVVQELQLQAMIPNRVIFWQIRCTNPFRQVTQRTPLPLAETKALTAIVVQVARRHTATLRHLLLVLDQLQAQNLPLETYAPLADYLDRFRRHFRKRMNLQRSGLFLYKDNTALNKLAVQLLAQLLFCAGTKGMERLWFSLFDGEVS